MRLLLDNQVVLWSLECPERSEEAVAAITDPLNSVDVSVATLWELAIKQSIGKLKVDGDLREHLRLQSFSGARGARGGCTRPTAHIIGIRSTGY